MIAYTPQLHTPIGKYHHFTNYFTSELTLEEHYCHHWQTGQQAELLQNRECAELCLRKGSLLVSRCRVMCLASSSLDDVLVFQPILINLITDTHCAEMLVNLAYILMFRLVLPYMVLLN